MIVDIIDKYKRKISLINKRIYANRKTLSPVDRVRLNVRKACYMQVIADLIILESELE